MRGQITIRRSLFLLLLLAASAGVSAQTVSPTVLGSAGGEGKVDGDITIMWTVGELAVTTLSDGNSVITQGFHQPPDGTSAVPTTSPFSAAVRLRPNPVTDELFVDLPETYSGKAEVELIDMLGQSVMQRVAEPGTTSLHLDVRTLPAGVYSIQLRVEEGVLSGMITIRR